VIYRGRKPIIGEDLTEAFTKARSAGAVCDKKNPLVVYGTHVLSADGGSWRFVQMSADEVESLISTLRGIR
jgi:hypothetical protein